MQEAGSGKQEAINIQTVQLVLFCDLILEWNFVNFHQDCGVHVKISCTLCYSCTKTRNQYRHVQKFCSGSYYMNTGIWNHWTEFCMLVHTICKQVLFLGNSWMREGIGLLQKCMQCKNVQMGLGKSKREWMFPHDALKHRKNCECCPHHSVFKGHNVIVHIVVLNCQKYNQCLKCQVSGHKNFQNFLKT